MMMSVKSDSGKLSVYCAKPQYSSPSDVIAALELPEELVKKELQLVLAADETVAIHLLLDIRPIPGPNWLQLWPEGEYTPEVVTRTEVGMIALFSASASLGQEQISRVLIVSAGTGFRFLSDLVVEPAFGLDSFMNKGARRLTQVDQEKPTKGRILSETLLGGGRVEDYSIDEDLSALRKLVGSADFGGKELSTTAGKQLNREFVYDWLSIIRAGREMLDSFLRPENRPEAYSMLQQIQNINENEYDQCYGELLFRVGTGATFSAFLDPEAPINSEIAYVCSFKRKGQSIELDIADPFNFDVVPLLKNFQSLEEFKTASLLQVSVSEGKRTVHSRPRLSAHLAGSYQTSNEIFVLSGAKWLKTSARMHERLRSRVLSLKLSSIAMPRFSLIKDKREVFVKALGAYRSDLSENLYNERASREKGYYLFDKAEVRKVVDRTPVELCDLYYRGTLVAVKRGYEAKSVEYACRQAVSSAYSIDSDSDFVSFLVKYVPDCIDYLPGNENNLRLTFTVAIIVPDSDFAVMDLGFKSKLALLDAKKQIVKCGFDFEYMFIPYES